MIVVHDVTDVISSRIVCFAHAHGVVREVDVAVVAYSTPDFALVDCYECQPWWQEGIPTEECEGG